MRTSDADRENFARLVELLSAELRIVVSMSDAIRIAVNEAIDRRTEPRRAPAPDKKRG
jgi:hypothetical protein